MPPPPTDQPPVPPNDGGTRRSAQLVLAAALGLPGFVVAGVLIGLWLDDRYGTSPGWTVGLGLGFLAVGIYQLIRSLR